jgi:hypothetical protein
MHRLAGWCHLLQGEDARYGGRGLECWCCWCCCWLIVVLLMRCSQQRELSCMAGLSPTRHAPSTAPTHRTTHRAQRTWQQAELDALAGCPRERWPLARFGGWWRMYVEARAGETEYALKLGEETDALEARWQRGLVPAELPGGWLGAVVGAGAGAVLGCCLNLQRASEPQTACLRMLPELAQVC